MYAQLTPAEHWHGFIEYLRPILDIEKPERDDVFRKATKFDRPDFGSNIPFELFSALSNLHQKDKQKEEAEEEEETEKNTYPDQYQEIQDETEDANQDSTQAETKEDPEEGLDKTDLKSQEGSGDSVNQQTESTTSNEGATKHEHHDKVTIDEKTMSGDVSDIQERRVPAEFEVQLKRSQSIDEQVIETKQDHDLIEEREMEKVRKNSQDKISPQEDSHTEQTPATSSEDKLKDQSPAEPTEIKPQEHTEAN